MSGWISSKLKVAETLLQQIDQQAAESLGKNEDASRSGDDDFTHATADIPKKPTDIIRLKKKNKKPPPQPQPPPEKTDSDFVPKSSLTDGDWTELLNGELLQDGKRQVPSASKPNTARKPDLHTQRLDACLSMNQNNNKKLNDEMQPGLDSLATNTSVVCSPKKKTDSPSETDSDSTSEEDSESERQRQREERRKRRELLLAHKAAAKAIEAIKDRENLVARLQGEKQSLDKIIDQRAKQQAHEASQLQMTMMETMEAVDLEKQKHNNTRMEVLMKLAKLETTNADLAKSLAAAQWSLEVEVKRVADLHRQVELKEANHEELMTKRESRLSGNKLTTSRGVEFEHEILEAENAFVIDKVGQLQEKAKTLEMAIQVTRQEIENPTEVEVELKRRLSQLTDHLIQKQAQVEALSSEKAMLMFRIEAVSRSLDESKSSLRTSKMNDIESGVRWEVRFQERVEKGQKHIIGSIVRQLDSIFLTAATFLRRNPVGKVWSIVYLVYLHLWVLYIFRSHTAVSNEGSGSGAVISLENINNTGV